MVLALETAAAKGFVTLHTVVDERSAAFFALGLSRVTGKPTALCCTSGSAGTHYYPALVEANQSGLPLVAITTDRPPALQGCGAPQAMEQVNLFGPHVRGSFALQPHPVIPDESSSTESGMDLEPGSHT